MAKQSNVTALKKQDDQLPAELMQQFEHDAGQGVSSSVEDNLVPFVGILQSNSPQVNKRHEKYIEGAEVGDILVTSLNLVWPGEVGLQFQACAFSRDWVEWKLRDQGGGFVGRHPGMPSVAREVPDPRDQTGVKKMWLMPSGTQIVDTRYHFGFILNGSEAKNAAETAALQAVISLSSTGHTFSRTWMTQMNNLRLPSGKAVPSRARRYQLTTVPKSNSVGEWFGWKVADRGWITDAEQYDRGTALFQAIRDGSLKAAAPEAPSSEAGDGDNIPF